MKMDNQQKIDYNRIAAAIDYIKTNFRDQPSLTDIAEHVHLSPFHFQRLFKEWAGTTPKKFLQYTSIAHAKKLLLENQSTIAETAFETGLSGGGRMHDLFIKIEGMTPAEYKNGAKNLSINYSFSPSLFGDLLVASTEKGICYMAFSTDEDSAIHTLKSKFTGAFLNRKSDELQEQALSAFQYDLTNLPQVKLHLKGTEFQLKVWEALLKIPMGQLSTYGTLAKKIEMPNASRAVGTAIGSNPIAFLIPCHRVIQSTGVFGGYMWGNTRKTAIIGWESAHMYDTTEV
jgi:AraC family transcriptional regulator of adaptative response/methylated-DNA-[protein]-cysteine methyltransferase